MDDDDRWSITVSSAPAAEPVTLAEAKRHLAIDSSNTDHDDYLTALIVAVREKAEAELRRALVRRTLVLTLDDWPCGGDEIITLPFPPLASVTSVEYTDANGATQTVSASNYVVDTAGEPGRIQPAYGFAWPTLREQIAAVRVTYVAGYAPGSGSPTDHAYNIPRAIRHGMLLTLGTLFEHRESVQLANAQALQLPDAAQALFWSHRVMSV